MSPMPVVMSKFWSPQKGQRLSILKALAHYNWNCKKSCYLSYTLQLFFTTATIFSTVLYMDNDFYKDFFRKIFVKIFVVCEGLKVLNPGHPVRHNKTKVHLSKLPIILLTFFSCHQLWPVIPLGIRHNTQLIINHNINHNKPCKSILINKFLCSQTSHVLSINNKAVG